MGSSRSRATVADAPPTSGSRYTVGSVARALRLLDIVAAGPLAGLTVSELARELGTSKSTAFALAHTLADEGYLRADGAGPRYQLGLALVHLGDVSANRLPLGHLCRPVLHALSAQTGLTTRAAVNDSAQPMFVERVDAAGAIRFHTPLGVTELADIEDGLAWLREKPYVDSARIGIEGWSYGGFMTSYALTHSQTFKIGIAGGTVSDWRNYDTIYTERYM